MRRGLLPKILESLLSARKRLVINACCSMFTIPVSSAMMYIFCITFLRAKAELKSETDPFRKKVCPIHVYHDNVYVTCILTLNLFL